MNISIEEMPREIDRLLEENERLEEELDKTRLSELDKEYRIDKAIEYIENNYMTYKEASAYRDGIDNDYKIQISSIADLIDILKGGE